MAVRAAHPPILPVPSGEPRPFWSVMIPTYNPAPNFLRQTLGSVLDQDPGADEMEIVVIDDHSAVDPAAELSGLGDGRVLWTRRRGSRVGIAENWNACIERARGRWVHILHQDDVVRPAFYVRLREGIENSPAIGAAFCRDAVIDAEGNEEQVQPLICATAGLLIDWIEHIYVALHLRASAVVVRRETYEAIGGFSPDLRYALDWDMWKRIAASYPIWYEPETLLAYRRHSGSASFGFMRSGTNIAEIRRSIELSESLLEPAIAADVSSRARDSYAKYAVAMALRALRRREVASGIAQLREARKLSSIPSVLSAVVGFLVRDRAALR
jgi:glycosyltransferase involved in cell wall biosynthesis